MSCDRAQLTAVQLLTGKDYLTKVQYRTDGNLAARQSIYAYQDPRIDLVSTVLGLAGLTGAETVVDVGCGNGIYLAGLAHRGHRGLMAGVDLSPGMLAAARSAAPDAGFSIGDAARLPIADDAADITLAPHMLYHLPDPAAAAAEFRRITRPGGQLLVVLNGKDHLIEFRELITSTAAAIELPAEAVATICDTYRVMTLDIGAELLSGVFTSVQRHDFIGELKLPGAEPVASYVASMRTHALADPAAFVAAVTERVPFGPDGVFRVRTHAGLLVCR
ncbi:MAG TPA: methyltransferase domain-containing protein [Streptosporangiaceae bacterium]|nr:methyltransferase domain-containing protein [Streptosporangiaceae bacterium]